ncbi:hypothetical protein [Rhizorhabdus sp.]|uniref:hypothetical protein n=1 Tax=Rhizorhabdus sp. TaxID=1968843 RepID=UPI0035B2BB2E
MLADRLGVSQAYISLLERAVNPRIPPQDIMDQIHVLSGGEVEPNDFYSLSPLPHEMRKAG